MVVLVPPENNHDKDTVPLQQEGRGVTPHEVAMIVYHHSCLWISHLQRRYHFMSYFLYIHIRWLRFC